VPEEAEDRLLRRARARAGRPGTRTGLTRRVLVAAAIGLAAVVALIVWLLVHSDGNYLPSGTKVGSAKADFLTVGTYPQRHAFATLRANGEEAGHGHDPSSGGGLAFQYRTHPTSVCLAFPHSDYEIEVFDLSPARAVQLVRTGQIKPVARRLPRPSRG